MVTPSLVMVGGPNFLSRTTLRPRGPRVTLTVSASLSTPRSRARRASSLNLMILAMPDLSEENGWRVGGTRRKTTTTPEDPGNRARRGGRVAALQGPAASMRAVGAERSLY